MVILRALELPIASVMEGRAQRLYDLFPSGTLLQGSKSPIVGKAGESFAGQLLLAGAVTVAILLLITLWRRYAAARAAKCDILQSARYAFGLRRGAEEIKARGLTVGADNRRSTSKTNALLWTLILIFFIIAMAMIFGTQTDKYSALIHSISPLHLVLLGGPFAAAVLAKAVVSGSVNDGTTQKSKAAAPRVADVFSDDDGNTDLVDTQYLMFNLIVAGIVLTQFVHAPGNGAPPIPDFLAGLTGVSAATYVANKAVVTAANPPAIDRIVPPLVSVGGQVQLLGKNFLAPGETGRPSVFFDGLAGAVSDPVKENEAVVTVPDGVRAGKVSVAIRTPSGAEATADDKLEVR